MGLAQRKEANLTITIDKFGRVVIPLEVREELGLRPGTKLQVAKETNEAILLTIVEEEPLIEDRNGWPLFQSQGPKKDYDIVETINKSRTERNKKILNPNQ